MKADQLIAIIIRLCVIYLFLNSILPLMVMLPSLWKSYMQDDAIVSSTFSVAVLSLMLWAAWKFALSIARGIIPKSDEVALPLSMSVERLESLCFSVLGMWLCASNFAGFLRLMISMRPFNPQEIIFSMHALQYLVAFAIGLWLLLGSRGILKVINKLRGREG